MGGKHLLLTADAVGGVWQYSTDLVRALQPYGHEVTLALLGPAPTPAQRAEADGIANLHLVETGLELDWLAESAAPVLAAQAQLGQMAADLRVDLVQLHTPALASEGRFPCPVIAILHSCVASWWSAAGHGPMPVDFLWRTAMVERGLKRSDLAIAPSAAFANLAGEIYGAPVVPVHNGRALSIPAHAMHDHVFTAGRLWDEAKNVAVLDEAASRIAVPFRAAGPVRAPHGGSIELKALRPVGNLDSAALASHLGTRPVFASAALYEPFGLAVLEAAIAGCALVLSDIPTFRELWSGAAYFVDPRDPRGFAEAIEDLLGDTAARIAAGERAQQRARRYSVEAMASRMAAHYAALEQRAAA